MDPASDAFNGMAMLDVRDDTDVRVRNRIMRARYRVCMKFVNDKIKRLVNSKMDPDKNQAGPPIQTLANEGPQWKFESHYHDFNQCGRFSIITYGPYPEDMEEVNLDSTVSVIFQMESHENITWKNQGDQITLSVPVGAVLKPPTQSPPKELLHAINLLLDGWVPIADAYYTLTAWNHVIDIEQKQNGYESTVLSSKNLGFTCRNVKIQSDQVDAGIQMLQVGTGGTALRNIRPDALVEDIKKFLEGALRSRYQAQDQRIDELLLV
jgi:hypothetical protein